MQYKETMSRKIFVVLNYFFGTVIALICLLPVMYIFSVSMSDKTSIVAGKVMLFPVGITLDNYRYVVKDAQFYRSFGISIIRTFSGTAIFLSMGILSAYPLSISRQKFRGRPFFMWFFFITMLFNGGLIPTYIVVSKTGLIDTMWSLLLPACVPVYYIILMQNYMKTLPDAITESAQLDGADHFTIMWKIILPLCKPALATIILFLVVDHWNSWFDGMLYINDNRKFPLQTYLRTLIVEVDLNKLSDVNSLSNLVATSGADSAKIFVAMVPVLCVYPFAQKYFTTGIVAGSIKG